MHEEAILNRQTDRGQAIPGLLSFKLVLTDNRWTDSIIDRQRSLSTLSLYQQTTDGKTDRQTEVIIKLVPTDNRWTDRQAEVIIYYP